MLSGKVMIIRLIAGSIKKRCYLNWVIFQNHVPIVKIKVELDLSNYATKSDLQQALIHQNLLKRLI